ncbi:MAG TPA: efflux RND transporter periplasmic adaptor subunit, partial [Myxococcaceae bacterium]|nr:efflux RND transporter periplasmic adaptor subunit [Myxococcaceae bacterium]
VGGVLRSMEVDEGAQVRAGQRLASLDRVEIDNQVSQALNAFEKAERDYERVKSMYESEAVPLNQVQDASTALGVSRSVLSIARFNQRYAAIVAPSHGRVLRRMAEPGELVAPGAPIFILSSADRGWVVRVGVADRDVVRLSVGNPARITLDAFPGQTFQSTVTEIAATATPPSGTFEVELTLAEPPSRVVSGLVAKAVIAPGSAAPLQTIPIEALSAGQDGGGSVFIVGPDGRTAKRVPVEVAFIYKDRAAVSSGLESVDAVVTEGAGFLSDGAPLRLVR